MHGFVLLSTGEVLEPRYRALDLEPLASEDCYIAILELTSTVKEDQRLYHVIVENDRGSDRRALLLKVDEPGQVNFTRARANIVVIFYELHLFLEDVFQKTSS